MAISGAGLEVAVEEVKTMSGECIGRGRKSRREGSGAEQARDQRKEELDGAEVRYLMEWYRQGQYRQRCDLAART